MAVLLHGDFSVISQAIAATLPNMLLLGAALTAAALLLTRFMPAGSSRIRFAVWFLALIATVFSAVAFSLTSLSTSGVIGVSKVAVMLPVRAASYLLATWLVGTTLMMLHIALGLARLRRLRSSAVEVDTESLDPLLRSTMQEVQRSRRVTLCVSDVVRVPAAIGYFRPRVVLPRWAFDEVPPAELNAILLHELAHLRRWDDWTNLAQKVIKAVFFFHPAVWYIESRLALEREMACDDVVLQSNYNPRAYAASLVGLAEKSFLRRGVQLAQAAVSHVAHLKLRIVEILQPERPAKGSGLVAGLSVTLMATTVLLASYGMAHAPRWIAFSNTTDTGAVALNAREAPISIPGLEPVRLSYSPEQQPKHVVPKSRAPVVRRAVHKTTHTPPVKLVKRAMLASQDFGMPIPVTLVSQSLEPTHPTGAVLMIHEQFVGDGSQVIWRLTVVRISLPQQYTERIPKQI
jgi:beta-lactamase regulating signal transducer with metallopeptidase domain